jgi:hypothetical protein
MTRPLTCACCGHFDQQHWPACENYVHVVGTDYRCTCQGFVREASVGASYVEVVRG